MYTSNISHSYKINWNAKRRSEGEVHLLRVLKYFNHLPPSVPIYASPHIICTDPSLSSFSLTTHWYSHIQQRLGWFIPRQRLCFDGGFHFRADESAPVMWWNECFVHQLPPSTQIDGACNWRPLCVIAKINRHCCGHGRSMSCTKQASQRGRNLWAIIFTDNIQ